MRFLLTAKNLELTDDQKTLLERRFDFALARFSDVIDRVSVLIEDDNGPRGGIDKMCRVQLHLRGLGEMNVSERDAEILAAGSRAAERMGRAVARALLRKRELSRAERRPADVHDVRS